MDIVRILEAGIDVLDDDEIAEMVRELPVAVLAPIGREHLKTVIVDTMLRPPEAAPEPEPEPEPRAPLSPRGRAKPIPPAEVDAKVLAVLKSWGAEMRLVAIVSNTGYPQWRVSKSLRRLVKRGEVAARGNTSRRSYMMPEHAPAASPPSVEAHPSDERIRRAVQNVEARRASP